MENPYQSPETPVEPPNGAPYSSPVARRPGGLVGHVRIVAVLMIIQGAFVLVAAVVLLVMAVMMPMMIMQEGMDVPQRPGEPSPEEFIWIFPVIYGGLGLAMLIIAVLNIYAGIRNFKYRSRTLGIVAMASGLLSLLTCYCLPTAIAVMVYGLIVYLNYEVEEAFRMGEAGYASSDIRETFRRNRM